VALSLFLPRGFTYVSEEANLPTWWTVSLLVGAAGLHVQAGSWRAAPVAVVRSPGGCSQLFRVGRTRDPDRNRRHRIHAPSGASSAQALDVALGGRIGLLLASDVGMEAVSGLLLADQPILSRGSDLGQILVTHLEEFGEMAGAALAACSPLAALRLRGVSTDFGVSLAAR